MYRNFLFFLTLCLLCSCDSSDQPVKQSQRADMRQMLDFTVNAMPDIYLIDQYIATDILIQDVHPFDSAIDMTVGHALDPQQIDDLIPLIAQNQCRIFRDCCDDKALEGYFFNIQNSTSYSDELKSKLPPQSPIDAQCEERLTEVLTIAPFGDWVRAVKENLVRYVPQKAVECLDQMANAQCGLDSYQVLFDSTCFALSAPSGGESQRKAFDRTNREGSTCHPIRDGIGASFFGTCDPINAFCCIADENGDCMPGSPTDTGTCRTVSVIGEACQTIPLQLCQTGLSCDPFSNRCIAEGNAPLQAGEICYENFNLIGECIDSYCDVSGSNQCLPLIEDGGNCSSPFSCLSGGCNEGVCGPILFCTGKS